MRFAARDRKSGRCCRRDTRSALRRRCRRWSIGSCALIARSLTRRGDRAEVPVGVDQLRALEDRLANTMLVDGRVLRRRIHGLAHARTAGENALRAVEQDIDRAVKRFDDRRAKLPKPTYPQELPVA